jgi:hypothetical protein
MGDPASNDHEYFTHRSVRGLSAVQREILRVAYPVTREVLGSPQRVCPAIELAKADWPAARGLKQRDLAHVWRAGERGSVLAQRKRYTGACYLRLTDEGKAYVVSQLRPHKVPKLTPAQKRWLVEACLSVKHDIYFQYIQEGTRRKAVVGPRWSTIVKLHHLGLVRHEQQGPILTVYPTTLGLWIAAGQTHTFAHR